MRKNFDSYDKAIMKMQTVVCSEQRTVTSIDPHFRLAALIIVD